jgi:hypothetical protein
MCPPRSKRALAGFDTAARHLHSAAEQGRSSETGCLTGEHPKSRARGT